MSKPPFDMDNEEFKRYGMEVFDRLVTFFSHPESYRVVPLARPGELKEHLPSSPPRKPESMDRILKDIDEMIVPRLTHWNHPGFMAYFAISSSKPAILAELLSAGYNVNGMLWKTSPAATELEEVVLDWLRQALGLPDVFIGAIHDTASTSSLIALVAAREFLNQGIRERGLAGRTDLPPLIVYTSEQAHSSIERAAIIAGIGQSQVRKIPTDALFRIDPGALEVAIQNDIRDGFQPCCVVATVGTTSFTSVDPVKKISEICKRYGVWLHVDAAYGGIASIVPEMRWVLDGCFEAHSIVVNPHKWFFVPIDCSVLYCRRIDILKQAFSLVPEYLRTKEQDVTNFMDYGVALGRRFRALKLWMVFRYFGVEGIIERLRYHLALAQTFRSWVEREPDFELVAPTTFSVVCFRFCPPELLEKGNGEVTLNLLNMSLLEKVNESGKVFLSHTKAGNNVVLRLAIGNLQTTEDHVREAWNLVKDIAREIAAQKVV
jgi:aromatic-L-amino-acid decarboxylase